MNFPPIEKRFVRYLTENVFCIFLIIGFGQRSRDHRTHGIVENSMADPMRALPGPCGASLGSEGAPKGQKYAFGTQSHLFREISRNYENRESKILVTNLEHVCPGLLAPI